MTSTSTLRSGRRPRHAVAAGATLALSVTMLGAGTSSARAADVAAANDTAVTGSGVPVTVDVLANDQLAGQVSSVRVGAVSGGDAATVSVGDDFRITFANANADYPNSSVQRVFKTADFTVPYTVVDTEGNVADATLTVTVAGKPVSPAITSWLLDDPSDGVKLLTNVRQLDLYAYPQTVSSWKSAIPGYGVTVTGLVDAEHATAVPVAGGIELRAAPSGYIGEDIITLQLTDAWGRTVEHTAGVSWVERAAISKLRTKVGVGEAAHIDLAAIIAGTSFASFENAGFSTTYNKWNGTIATGAHPQEVVFTPTPGFVGTSTDSAGPRLGWAYWLSNPWKKAGWTGPSASATYNTVYIDVQAPPLAADVAASTTAGMSVGLDLRTPATLPWSASTFELREGPGHGTVEVSGDGQVRYTPESGFPAADVLAASDSFTYAWVDDLGQESVARATVTVRNGPVLADHALTTPAGVAVTVDLLTDAFGDGVTITGVGTARSGAADLGGATATYLPQDGFVGHDSFSYQGVDAHGQPAQATVRVQVLAEPAIVDEDLPAPSDPATDLEPALPAPDGAMAFAAVLGARGEQIVRLASTGSTAAALLGAGVLLTAAGVAGVLVRNRRSA